MNTATIRDGPAASAAVHGLGRAHSLWLRSNGRDRNVLVVSLHILGTAGIDWYPVSLHIMQLVEPGHNVMLHAGISIKGQNKKII
jgi:hypothetical protein